MLPDGRDRVRHNRCARSTAPHPVFRTWRRKRVIKRATIDEALWSRVVAQLPFLAGLSADDARRLRELAVLFLHEKEIAAAGGLELTDEIRVAIALQACLPILNLGLDIYDGWVGIVVYPGEFRVRRQELDDDGVMHEWDDELSGEAWPGGPVALSWEDVELGVAHAGEERQSCDDATPQRVVDPGPAEDALAAPAAEQRHAIAVEAFTRRL